MKTLAQWIAEREKLEAEYDAMERVVPGPTGMNEYLTGQAQHRAFLLAEIERVCNIEESLLSADAKARTANAAIEMLGEWKRNTFPRWAIEDGLKRLVYELTELIGLYKHNARK